jgi:hypothetical protein
MPADVSLSNAKDADKTFKEQVCRPMQEELEHKINFIIKEYTDAFMLRFNELALTDEETQSRIDASYLVNKVVLPNEVRSRMGRAPIEGGDVALELKPQQASEMATDAKGTRARDQKRTLNAPDKMSGGRNPQGEGRQQE